MQDLANVWESLLDGLGRWPSFDLFSPEYLWMAWVLAALLAWGLLRHFGGWRLSFSVLKGEGGVGWLRSVVWLPRSLRLLGLGLLLMALLRPQTVKVSADKNIQSRDIFLALDVSGSMQANDLTPSRVEAAKATLKAFVDRLDGDRVGLVVFAGKAFVQCPLTLDHNVVKYFISQVDLSTVAVDGTAMGDGVLVALARLAQEPKSGQVIILATDGGNNAGTDPRLAAQVATAAGVKLYTIGMGRKGGAVMQYRDPFGGVHNVRLEEPDEKTLTAMAEATGGRYFRATDAGSLQGVYSEIARLEKRDIKVKSRRDVDEHFYPFLLAGALVLLLEAVLRLRVRVAA
jgi:Ca-activated chloride channel family protein